jgi:hypothetical protein
VSTDRTGFLAAQLTVDIVDHLEKIDDGPSILTALGAAVVVELDRFDCTIEQFADSLVGLKIRRDAELARQKREN